MRHLRAWLVSFAVLVWFWLLLAGEWDRREWIAATSVAALAAAIGELARTRARVRPAFSPHWLLRAGAVPATIVTDFAILVWVLLRTIVRREVTRGRFVTRPFPPGYPAAASPWLAVAATYSPNAYVVTIEAKEDFVLLHDLVQRRASERPV